MSHSPKPHKAKHKMSAEFQKRAEKVAAGVPGAQAGDDNDGVQRMYDAVQEVADAGGSTDDKALAALDSFADASVHLAAMARAAGAKAEEIFAIGRHNLTEFLDAMKHELGDLVFGKGKGPR
jgi:hypothetical protein